MRVFCLLVWILPTIALANVFGEDDRVPIPKEFSLEAVGRIKFPSGTFCTATLVGRSTILTAAHCFYDRSTNAIKTVPIYFEGRTNAGEVISSPVKFAYHSVEQPFRQYGKDWALGLLEQPLGETLGYMDIARDEFDFYDFEEEIFLAAHHHDLPNEQLFLSRNCRIYSAQESAALYHDCDLTAGASGAPIFYLVKGRPVIFAVQSAQYSVFGIEQYIRYRRSVRNVAADCRGIPTSLLL